MAVSTPHLYPVRLSDEQRERLRQIVSCGRAPVRKVRHAQVLLASDRNRPGGRLTRDAIARALHMHVNTVDRIRKRFAQEGEAPALNRRPRPPERAATPPRLDGRAEAHLVAICCSSPPPGRTRWTLRLLADELARRRIVTRVCAETVRKTLKKTRSSPGASRPGASPSVTRPASWPRWRTCWTRTPSRATPTSR